MFGFNLNNTPSFHLKHILICLVNLKSISLPTYIGDKWTINSIKKSILS